MSHVTALRHQTHALGNSSGYPPVGEDSSDPAIIARDGLQLRKALLLHVRGGCHNDRRVGDATNVQPISGPFQSPSGNIRCTAFTSDGRNTVRCEAVEHTW